jgi:hypothetical protein
MDNVAMLDEAVTALLSDRRPHAVSSNGASAPASGTTE